MTKADDYNRGQVERGTLTVSHLTELVRFWQMGHQLQADGMAGPVTIATIDKFVQARGEPAMPPARCWPLRALVDGRKPVVTSGFRNPDRPKHNGCDLFYAYRSGDPAMAIGDAGRTPKWWIPEGTEAIAQADGVVVAAGPIPTGGSVWIEHDGGYFTAFRHLDVRKWKLLVKVGDRVALGQVIGIVGDNPIDYDADHLHCELHAGPLSEYPKHLVDPQLFWKGAQVLPAK